MQVLTCEPQYFLLDEIVSFNNKKPNTFRDTKDIILSRPWMWTIVTTGNLREIFQLSGGLGVVKLLLFKILLKIKKDVLDIENTTFSGKGKDYRYALEKM